MRKRQTSAWTVTRGVRALAVAGLVVTAVFSGQSAAQAAAPDRGFFPPINETFVDSEVCAPEGFDVNVTETETNAYKFFFNEDGSFRGALVNTNYTAVISANGHTIYERDRWQNFFYLDGTYREVGLTVHIQGPGIVQRDAGQIVFNADDSVAYIRGPHPQFLGQTFCFALLP